jgi:hypothetical protein
MAVVLVVGSWDDGRSVAAVPGRLVGKAVALPSKSSQTLDPLPRRSIIGPVLGRDVETVAKHDDNAATGGT